MRFVHRRDTRLAPSIRATLAGPRNCRRCHRSGGNSATEWNERVFMSFPTCVAPLFPRGAAAIRTNYPTAANGSTASIPIGAKCRGLRVATTSPWARAKSAPTASRAGKPSASASPASRCQTPGRSPPAPSSRKAMHWPEPAGPVVPDLYRVRPCHHRVDRSPLHPDRRATTRSPSAGAGSRATWRITPPTWSTTPACAAA